MIERVAPFRKIDDEDDDFDDMVAGFIAQGGIAGVGMQQNSGGAPPNKK